MGDFTIVDASGTPINYGTRTRGAANLSPEQACAASSMPSYLGGKPSQFQSAPPVPSYTGGPAPSTTTPSASRLQLPPAPRSSGPRMPRSARTLGASADMFGRSDAERNLNPSNVCVPLNGIHVNATSEWSLDWQLKCSNAALASSQGQGGPSDGVQETGGGCGGALQRVASHPLAGLFGLAAGAALGGVLGSSMAPSDATLALLRLPGGLWVGAMQAASLPLAPLSVATAACDLGWAQPRPFALSTASAAALVSLVLSAAAAATLGFVFAGSMGHTSVDWPGGGGPSGGDAGDDVGVDAGAEVARIGALWLPGWGGGGGGGSGVAGADAVVAQRMVGALGAALLLGLQASSTRGADGQLVARVASAALRLLHGFSARLLCLAAPALFVVAAADVAAASRPGAPSPPSLLGLLPATVAAQAAHAALCALLVALLRAASRGAPTPLPPPAPLAAVRVARPQLSADGDEEMEETLMAPQPPQVPPTRGGGGGGGGGGGLAALGAAVQAGAAGAATGSALAALPLTLRSGMHSGGCERTARLVLPVAACVCCDGVVAARCAALVLVAGRSAASLSVAQLAAAAATVALVSLSSPAAAGPSAAVGAAAALLGLAPSADDLALLGAIEVATRPAAAAASTLGGYLAAAVAGRAGPWERSGVASGAAGIPDDEDPLSS